MNSIDYPICTNSYSVNHSSFASNDGVCGTIQSKSLHGVGKSLTKEEIAEFCKNNNLKMSDKVK